MAFLFVFLFLFLFCLTLFTRLPQLGVDYHEKPVKLMSKDTIRLQLWDIQGKDSVEKGGGGRTIPLLFLNRSQQRVTFSRVTLGQARMRAMTGHFYRKAVGALVVLDVTSEPSWCEASKWKSDLDNKASFDDQTLPVILMANKSDLIESSDTREEVQRRLETFGREHGFSDW